MTCDVCGVPEDNHDDIERDHVFTVHYLKHPRVESPRPNRTAKLLGYFVVVAVAGTLLALLI